MHKLIAFVRVGFVSAFLCLTAPVVASLYDETFNFSPNLAIPDNNLSGLALNVPITSQILFIENVEVTLNISGGFNGDYYVYLRHETAGGTGFSILLNRVGRTSSNPDGYPDAGMTVTFSGSAVNDIHTYRSVTNPGGGPLTLGTWTPDGRNVNPANVLDTDARTATLDSFNGLNANGTWTLYLADVAALGQGTIVSWSLHIQGVPEPATFVGGALAAGATLLGLRRRRKG